MDIPARLIDDMGQALADLQKILAIPVKKEVELCYADAHALAFLRTLERFQALVKNMTGQADRLKIQDILKVFGSLVDQEQARFLVGMLGALGNLSIDREWYAPEEVIHYDKYIELIPSYAEDLEALYSYVCTHFTATTKETIYESH